MQNTASIYAGGRNNFKLIIIAKNENGKDERKSSK